VSVAGARFFRILALAAVVATGLMTAASAAAEPRFAVREGVQCAHCHVNRTGGGMRTAYGTVFAQTNLPTVRLQGVLDPRLGESFRAGANIRLANKTVLAAKAALGDKVYTSRTRNGFEMSEANVYLQADLVPDRLIAYVDETIGPEGATNREAFLLLDHEGFYAKAGRFMLPFGLRLQDDIAFIRDQTGFTYANQDLGVEVGVVKGALLAALSLSNGSLADSDTNLPKQVTGRVEWLWSFGRVGASAAYNDSSGDDHRFSLLTAGAHLGLRLGRLILLGELDWIRGFDDQGGYQQWALYSAASFEAWRGLYLRATFEAFDPLRSLPNNERDRFVLSVSWFAVQMLELRASYRLNRDIPQRIRGAADELLLEAHAFF